MGLCDLTFIFAEFLSLFYYSSKETENQILSAASWVVVKVVQGDCYGVGF